MSSEDLASLGGEWLAERFDSVPDQYVDKSVPQWAEDVRYLPEPNRYPGPYRWKVAPYLEEIAWCMSESAPVRDVAVMKGVQLGMTVGILENTIGYWMDHVGTASMMMVTADAELAQIRMETSIMPMVQASGLYEKIQSADPNNPRKTGATDKKIEWRGGGFLIPFGAQNANKLRSIPIQIMLRDEVEAWPDVVGKDGDPMQLTYDRTSSYEDIRKILDISTPLIDGTSKIKSRFLRGDQRYYYVRCLSCGYPQVLTWKHVDKDTGERRGITWETENGMLVEDSVRYRCVNCGHMHTNEQKTRLFAKDNAYWEPTADPVSESVRSYHISGLYSPVGFKTWATQVQQWLDAWDEKNGRAKDVGLLQVFYNSVLGQTWVMEGDRIRMSQVSTHKRAEYALGEIPNEYAEAATGGRIVVVLCTVDVQGDYLAVATWGWAPGQRVFLIDYWHIEGDTSDETDPCWQQMSDLVEEKRYKADDGREYRIAITLIDSSYQTDRVYSFCAQYVDSVFPIQGRDNPPKSANLKEFSFYSTKLGTRAMNITVDIYKDRWSSRLRRQWDKTEEQPFGHFNAPHDVPKKMLEELTAESKHEIQDKNKNVTGYKWEKDRRRNELWDLLIYSNAALEMLMLDVCQQQLGIEYADPTAFWRLSESEALFFTPS